MLVFPSKADTKLSFILKSHLNIVALFELTKYEHDEKN